MTVAEQRSAVVQEAKSWRGTAFRHRQRLKGVGVDCGYLASACYEAVLGWPVQDFGAYPPAWMLHRSDEIYLEWAQKLGIEVDGPAAGDLALFKFGRCFGHGSIVTDWPMVIHADAGAGRVVESSVEQPPLARRQVRFFSPWKTQAL